MAFNENTVQRIRGFLQAKNAGFYETKMFGGVCFMVDGKMCCGTHIDKASGEDSLMCRIGEDAYHIALQQDGVTPMEYTGKPMKGYIYVAENGFATARDLAHWLQLCLDFNPLAKSGKKK
jgi:hypothetical protein